MTEPVAIRRFGGSLAVCATGPEHAAQLEELQRVVFPTLAPEERFRAPHYLRHIELFPEGQLCAVDVQEPRSVHGPTAPPDRLGIAGGRVVGMTSTIRMDFDFEHPGHTFADVIQGGWLTSHKPTKH